MREPAGELLRRRDVLNWTGLTVGQFRKLEESGTVQGTKLNGRGRNYYRKAHIRAVLIEPKQETAN